MKRKPLAYILISSKYKNEWAMRENGSYEDSNESPNHVYNFISRPPHYRINIFSKEELQSLIKSAAHCSTWGNGGEFSDKADAAIANVARKLSLILI